MEIRNYKSISISNLILIILNDKNTDIVRKCAEVELRKRIQNVGWEYDDLLHFDDKVIQQRGLNIENYLISPNVNMQQLIETYFMYSWQTDYYSNYLLFSEKHLCNEANFAAPFFSKLCNAEINNINRRLEKAKTQSQKDILILLKRSLEERAKKVRQEKQEIFKEHPIELLCYSDAMYQLDGDTNALFYEAFQNYSDEKMHRLLSSKLGMLKLGILETLNFTLFDSDIVQYLYGLNFVRKNSSKLNRQKRKLLHEARSGYEVNYEIEGIKKVLQRNKNG